MIPTSLFPRDGGCLLPVKDAVRRPLGAEIVTLLAVRLRVGRD